MKTRELYKLIKHNDKLADERHPMFERNKFVKFLIYFMVAYYAAIMLLLGVVMPFGLGDRSTGLAAFHVLDSGFYWLLMADFWLRFVMQDTPANKCKQYSLLPIRRSFLMNRYMVRAGLSLGNLFWGFFLVPFAFEGVFPLLGWSGVIGWLLGYWLLIVANSYVYLLTRAACMKNLLWCLVPAAIHLAIGCIAILPHHNILRLPSTLLIYAYAQWHILPFLAIIAIIAFLYWVNLKVQGLMVYEDIGKKEEVEVKSTSQMSFLNRYGALGEYLKMEVKLRLRNKQVRVQFFIGLGAILVLSGLMYFTPAYDGAFMTSFICLYDYIVLGMMTLIGIMCYEGNYIDGLMSRRESIYALLRAKYYFNTIMLILPFLITVPLMISGKISVWMSLGYLFMSVGVLYPILFQLAVYNKETMPLNQKLTGKQANLIQNIISIAILFVPIGLEKTMVLCLGNPGGYVALIIIGIIGFATHKWWLRNIYTRFMQRRYTNMEGFRASRNF